MRKKYDVALTYAGEDRGYVERVAVECERLGVRVFYDRSLTHHLWGNDLNVDCLNAYRHESSFVVAFISEYYLAKRWTKKEFEAARGAPEARIYDYLLPARFGISESPGMPSDIADVDLRQISAEMLAEIIFQKVSAHRQSEATIENQLAGKWSNEGTVFPELTHLVELELDVQGLEIDGVMRCSNEKGNIGLASVTGRRIAHTLVLSVCNPSWRGERRFGEIFGNIELASDKSLRRLSINSQGSVNDVLPSEAVLFPYD